MSQIESVIGGTGADTVTLLAAGTIATSRVESVIGTAGADSLTLIGSTGTSVVISNIETVTGTAAPRLP